MTDRSKRSIYTGDWIGGTQEQSSECRLWRQVISQAISDAYLDDQRNKIAVITWLETPDFDDVCDFAALHPEQTKKHFYKILESKPAIARFIGRKLKDAIERQGN
jgi:hypothetical protein